MIATRSLATQALLQKFAPVIYLHSKEQYFPAGVEWYMDRVTMMYSQMNPVIDPNTPPTWRDVTILADVQDSTIAAQSYTDSVTQISYFSGFSHEKNDSNDITPFFLAISDSKTQQGQGSNQNGHIQLDSPPVYCAVIDRPDINAVDLVYAFFYAFNGKDMNDPGLYTHESDWEHVIVRVDENESEILGIYFQAHGSDDLYSKWYFPPDTTGVDTFESYGDSRFVVYSALSGHASYTTAGEHPYTAIRGTDVTDQGYLWDPIDQLVVMDSSNMNWLDYSGLWGRSLALGRAPSGPVGQNWLKSKAGGPAPYTEIMLTSSIAQHQKSRVSNNFTLNIPQSNVEWKITGLPDESVATQIQFTVMEDKQHKNDQPRLSNVTDGTISAGKINRSGDNLYIARLTYTATDQNGKTKVYSHADVFKQLKVDSFTIVITAID